MKQLLDGYARFRAEVFPKRASLFQNLAESQKPSTLFITCADSRVVPDMILQTNPGDLFICRNAGNIVPPYGESNGGVSATIEYAVKAVNVQNIILCGHSDCGAMKAVLSEQKHETMPTVDSWLQHSHSALQLLKSEASQHQKWTPKEMLRALTRASSASCTTFGRIPPSPPVSPQAHSTSTAGSMRSIAARSRTSTASKVASSPSKMTPSSHPSPSHASNSWLPKSNSPHAKSNHPTK
jgi:carbonic anhydrase